MVGFRELCGALDATCEDCGKAAGHARRSWRIFVCRWRRSERELRWSSTYSNGLWYNACAARRKNVLSVSSRACSEEASAAAQWMMATRHSSGSVFMEAAAEAQEEEEKAAEAEARMRMGDGDGAASRRVMVAGPLLQGKAAPWAWALSGCAAEQSKKEVQLVRWNRLCTFYLRRAMAVGLSPLAHHHRQRALPRCLAHHFGTPHPPTGDHWSITALFSALTRQALVWLQRSLRSPFVSLFVLPSRPRPWQKDSLMPTWDAFSIFLGLTPHCSFSRL